MISTQDLEAIAAGRVIDSTQAPQIARELIAARAHIAKSRTFLLQTNELYEKTTAHRDAWNTMAAYDAVREAE